jgi:hypothetical protein
VPSPDLTDILIVSLGSTEGLRRADDELRDALQRTGASVTLVRPDRPPARRTLMLTDLAWARAARSAAADALGRVSPRAIVYSSTTAALLWPRPGAIRFDATAAGNRPGRHGLWQRPLERRRLEQAPLLLPWSDGALAEADVASSSRSLVVPVAVDPSGPLDGIRDIAAITYAANPVKKGLDLVLAAWRRVRGDFDTGGELVVAGVAVRDLDRAGIDVAGEQSVRVVGALAADEYRALVRRARVFVCAPRREDYGIAQLEALADGCALVTTPAPGPYAALTLARSLDPRLVSHDLGRALHVALAEPSVDYAALAADALAPLTRARVDAGVASELLPRLLGEAAARSS